MIFKAYKFRLYPTREQEEFLCRSFGATRWVYNYFLNYRDTKFKNECVKETYLTMAKKLTSLRKEDETSWLKEINAQSLQCAIANLDSAYIKFFKGLSKFPKFKKRNDKQSFEIPQNWKLKGNTVKIPKLETPLKFVKHRDIEGKICHITISKTKTNKYHISFCCEVENNFQQTTTGSEVGIDLGVKDLIVCSDGTKYENHKFLKRNLKKLKTLNRHLSRKKKGSKRREKAKLKIARLHEKITNSRNDLYDKISNDLTNKHSLICLESLNVKGMMKNHHLAFVIQDCAWDSLVSKIEYKAKWKGVTVVKIDQFYPSSKTCSVCNWKKNDLTLKDREWVCPNCGTHHDRDLNAAKNILAWGKRINSLSDGTSDYRRGGEVKLKRTANSVRNVSSVKRLKDGNQVAEAARSSAER
jgi:putative transposase